MGTDLHYIPGDFYRIDDRTGFPVRASRSKKEWTGLYVSTKVWEPRNTQDFVKGVKDDQTVPDARPRQTDTFIGPLTTFITTAAKAGDTTLKVDSSVRFLATDKVSIATDIGNFVTTVSALPSSTQILIVDPLPNSAAVNNVVTDLTAVAKANIG